jgi:hypothetical protein
MAGFLEKADSNLSKMGRMMETSGVDPVALAQEGLGVGFAQAVRRCSRCGATEACQQWLDGHAGAQAAAPEFCPNSDYFARSASREA